MIFVRLTWNIYSECFRHVSSQHVSEMRSWRFKYSKMPKFSGDSPLNPIGGLRTPPKPPVPRRRCWRIVDQCATRIDWCASRITGNQLYWFPEFLESPTSIIRIDEATSRVLTHADTRLSNIKAKFYSRMICSLLYEVRGKSFTNQLLAIRFSLFYASLSV